MSLGFSENSPKNSRKTLWFNRVLNLTINSLSHVLYHKKQGNGNAPKNATFSFFFLNNLVPLTFFDITVMTRYSKKTVTGTLEEKCSLQENYLRLGGGGNL